MALKLVSVETVPVTLSLAKKFRDMEQLPNERPLRSARAKHHVALIAHDKFFTPLWGCCEFEGVLYRGNGNHTSNVLACCLQAHSESGLDETSAAFAKKFLLTTGGKWKGSSPEDLPEVKDGGIQAVVETFYADEQRDLVDFFARYDSAVSARSNQDILGIYIAERVDLMELSRDRVRYALSGVVPAAKKDPTAFGLPEHQDVSLSTYRGEEIGKALRVSQIAKAVKWVVETVPDVQLYKNPVGAQVCAEVYATYGESNGEKIINTMIEQIETDTDPSAAFEAALNKRHNKPTAESLLKKGRNAVKEIARKL